MGKKTSRLLRFLSVGLFFVFFEAGAQDHPGYDFAAVDLGFDPKVMGLDFLPDGRMVLATGLIEKRPTKPSTESSVYIVDKFAGPGKAKVEKIATGFISLVGMTVAEGKIYVSDQDALYHVDQAGKTKVVDWPDGLDNHNFAFGPVYKKGRFYIALSTPLCCGGKSIALKSQWRGVLASFGLDGKLEMYATGLRTPNGVGLGLKGEVYVTDNQGYWKPASTLSHVEQGHSYGHRTEPAGMFEDKELPPLAWLPHGSYSRSPSQPMVLREGPHQGQILYGDCAAHGLYRVFTESVNGKLQGCVFKLNSFKGRAVNRLTWHKGSAYIGSVGSPGNWPKGGGAPGSRLVRLTPNGKKVFEILAVRSRRDGFEFEFTDQIREGEWSLKVNSWRYEPQAKYGGPPVGKKQLEVSSLVLSPDQRSLYAKINGIEAGTIVEFRFSNVSSISGEKPWTQQAAYTLNHISPSSAFENRPSAMVRKKDPFTHRTKNGTLMFRFYDGMNRTLTLFTLQGQLITRIHTNGKKEVHIRVPTGENKTLIVRYQDATGGGTQFIRLVGTH